MKRWNSGKGYQMIAGTLVLLITAYFLWVNSDRDRSLLGTEGDWPLAFDARGADRGKGNVLGVQPALTPRDYVDQQRFGLALERYFSAARQKGWLNEKTMVVFPEYLGTWLVVANERNAAYTASTTTRAMIQVVLCHPLAFLKEFLGAGRFAKDKLKYAIFKVKANQSAQIYHTVFAGLARKYRVTVVAGSILLPDPQIKAGQLQTASGPLYNVTVVYQPDGQPYAQIVRKSYLTRSESSFLTEGNPDQLPVLDTPAGKMGVLICADAWYPRAYEVLDRQKAELIVTPSFKTLDARLNQGWKGYNNHPAPKDVQLSDIGSITEEQALLKYSLAGRLKSTGAQWGMNVFLRGEFWDMKTDGYTITIDRNQVFSGKRYAGAELFNLWLP